MSHYLSDEDSRRVISSIADLEGKSTGEVRVHIEDFCELDPRDRALQVFHKLNMHKTKDQTGVLIYVALEDKKAAILGDKGIHTILGDQYWDATISKMLDFFKTSQIADGLIYAIGELGAQLASHFPETGIPQNELPNEISYGN